MSRAGSGLFAARRAKARGEGWLRWLMAAALDRSDSEGEAFSIDTTFDQFMRGIGGRANDAGGGVGAKNSGLICDLRHYVQPQACAHCLRLARKRYFTDDETVIGRGHAVRFRSVLIAATTLLVGVAPRQVMAQVVSTPVQPDSAGWSFNLTPYFWLTTFRADLQAKGPLGNTVTESVSLGINDYISDLNFAFMGGAEARYGRFSVLTDLVYASFSFTTSTSKNSTSHLDSVNLPSGPIPIPRDLQSRTGSRLNAVIGQLAGGYTVLEGPWGNLDVIAGFRALGIGSTLNWTLAANIAAPDGTVALARDGSSTANPSVWNGIGGIRGRFNVANSKFFFPYYLDAGGGGVPFTWQAYAGVGYQAGFADLSLGYRWLAFEGHNQTIRKLELGGALLAAAFRF